MAFLLIMWSSPFYVVALLNGKLFNAPPAAAACGAPALLFLILNCIVPITYYMCRERIKKPRDNAPRKLSNQNLFCYIMTVVVMSGLHLLFEVAFFAWYCNF